MPLQHLWWCSPHLYQWWSSTSWSGSPSLMVYMPFTWNLRENIHAPLDMINQKWQQSYLFLFLTALYLIAVSVLAGFWGQFFVRRLVKMLKRASIIIFILSSVIFASALTMGMYVWKSIKTMHGHPSLPTSQPLNLLNFPCLRCGWHRKVHFYDEAPWVHGLSKLLWQVNLYEQILCRRRIQIFRCILHGHACAFIPRIAIRC